MNNVVEIDKPTASLADEVRMGQGDIELDSEQISIAIERPDKQKFFRVHPDSDLVISAGILQYEDHGDRTNYLVTATFYKQYHDTLEGDVSLKILYAYVLDTGKYGLWPIAAPSATGNVRDWTKAAIEAAKLARTSWVRLKPVRSQNTYHIILSKTEREDPEWPEWGIGEWLERAFPDELVIRDESHPVYRKLQGLDIEK